MNNRVGITPRCIPEPREYRDFGAQPVWRAQCPCGWRGKDRSSFIAAADDAVEHDREQNGDDGE